MADTKISALTAITGANTATGDEFALNDVSDTTMAASGTNKKITRANLLAALAQEGTTFQPLDGDLTAIAGLTSAADKGVQFTGAGTAGTFDLLSGAWTAFTPTLSDGWALGNSTYTAAYARVGRMIFWYASITVGSSATKGTGMRLALPVTAASSIGASSVAGGVFADVGTNNFVAIAVDATTSAIDLRAVTASGTHAYNASVTSSVPFTWATGDIITVGGFYEAAS